MADVFISYARSTAIQAQAAAIALRSLGYTVWLDDELPAHRAYRKVIEEQVAAAKAVLVLWSSDAIDSEWVLSEAERGREARKLIQGVVDGAPLPMPFDQIQCADLKGWTGDSHSAGWRKVVASVAMLLSEDRSAAATAETDPAFRSMQREEWHRNRVPSNSLPAERDSFVGRRDAIDALRARFSAGAKLVSIVGIGGTGKTRLATRFAWENLDVFSGGAWFCDLSQARTRDGIAFAVAQGLQIALGAVDPVVQLGQAIAGRGHCLVVLDNFEQVADHAEATLGQWIERAPMARYVVTSREVLGIVGESVLPLEPLSGDDAVELFVKRAAAVSPDYAPQAEDLRTIGRLVHSLDGLPLAIELAAARVRVTPPGVLMARINDRFDLIGAKRGRQERQLTLRAAFDWSWDLLGDAEKASLAMLSVFEGGFTLDSAAAVIATAGNSSRDTPDAVQGLVDKSLVRSVGEGRFDLLETVREYAAQRLATPGSFVGSGTTLVAATRARHWRYFAALGTRRGLRGAGSDANNLVAACRAATDASDASSAAACLAVAWSLLRLIGPYQVVVDMAEQVAALQELTPAESALADYVAGDALALLGDWESAHAHLNRGLANAKLAKSSGTVARILITLAEWHELNARLVEVRSNLDAALRLAEEIGDPELQMRALNALGVHCHHLSRWSEAKGHYARALELARALKDRHMEGGLLGNLGGVGYDMGDLEAAQADYEESLRVAIEMGDRMWEGNARSNLGLIYQERGRRTEAREQFEIALEMARQVGHVQLEYTVQCNLGILLAGEGRFEDAGTHFQRAVDAAVACSDRRAEGQFRGYLALNLARLGRFSEATVSLDIGERLLSGISDQLSLALLQCDRAEVDIHRRDLARARHSYDAASRIADELQCKPESELRHRLIDLGRRLAVA